VESSNIKVYTPESALKRPTILISEMWKSLGESRVLSWRLAVRDTKALYRQSILGILWAVIMPLANTLTWIFLRRTGVVDLGVTDLPYPVYVFAGAMLWAIFVESMQMPLQKNTANRSIVTKIKFPYEALIISGIYQAFFNSAIKIALLIVGLILLGYVNFDYHLLLFPFAVLALILAGTALGLFLTPVGMLYSDISKGLPLVFQYFMFLTPAVYAVPKTGVFADIIAYNPITPLLVTARNWLTGFPSEVFNQFIWVTAFFLFLLFIGWVMYRVAMPFLIERMSS
jgi:lipopolysaccharide transport system permease protein